MINPNDITTVRVDELPPDAILLTDIFPFETLSDSALKKATFQQLVDFININSNAFQFEVKTLLVDQSYINDNFETNGIGKNLCLGWRIATELNGLVTIGQGVGYPVGSLGGSKDAVVIAHSHTVGALGNVSNNKTLRFGTNSEIETSFETLTTSEVGVSGANKNMQPYLVALKIVKL